MPYIRTSYVNKDTRKNDKIKWGSHFYVRMSLAKRGIRNKNGWTKINKSAKFWASHNTSYMQLKAKLLFLFNSKCSLYEYKYDLHFSLHFSSIIDKNYLQKSLSKQPLLPPYFETFLNMSFFFIVKRTNFEKFSLVCHYHFIQCNKRLEKLSDFEKMKKKNEHLNGPITQCRSGRGTPLGASLSKLIDIWPTKPYYLIEKCHFSHATLLNSLPNISKPKKIYTRDFCSEIK